MEPVNELANDESNKNDLEEYEPNVYFEPVVKLPLVEKITLEEDETLLVKLRAKLYRFDSSETPSVWKERGTGEIKLLHHLRNNTVRIVMRRDKTLKICANHFITPSMKLQRLKNDRKNWWMWSVATDFADEVPKAEIFAMKLATEENADIWKEKFVEGQKEIQKMIPQEKLEQDGESEQSVSDETSSESEAEEPYEDALDKSVSHTTEGLSESVLKLDISK